MCSNQTEYYSRVESMQFLLLKMKFIAENTTPLFMTHKCEIILGFCALFFAFVTAMAIKKSRTNFPPGPMGLPLVGYLPFLTRNLHLDFIKLGRKYGDVFSLKLGTQDVVILHGGDAVIEAFNKPEFLGKPKHGTFQRVVPNSAFNGSNFLLWKEQRKIVIKCMKALGLGKTKIEEDIMDEISHFIEFCRYNDAQPTDIRTTLSSSISNNICCLIFGKRLEYENPKRQFLDKNVKDFAKLFSQIYWDVLFPWIRFIPFSNKFLRCHKTKDAVKNYERFFQEELNERIKTFNRDYVRDFFDQYLIEIDDEKEKHETTSCNQNMLISNAIDLFFAASETVQATFLWFIYIIAAFPDVQKKVQKEMKEVMGLDKAPEYADMRYMPYTHAVMLEMMRWKSVGTMSLMHYTLADTTVGGYNVPKDTIVIANLWNVHHDPRYWEEPQKFLPERFISDDGKSVVKPKYFMPFFVGKRACFGESMAFMELFLYLTSILREFDIVFPDETEVTFKAKLWFTYQPEPYMVRFLPRK